MDNDESMSDGETDRIAGKLAADFHGAARGYSSDEASDNEEPEQVARKKVVKKRKTNMFIEDQAAVDEDDSEEDEQSGESGFEELEFDDSKTRPDKGKHRALDLRKEREKDVDAEEIARRLKEKYGRSDTRIAYQGDTEHVPQNLLIPSVEDPKLWLVGCKPGKEKDLVLRILRKFFNLQNTPSKLMILSAFFRESIPGYLYIEATKESHVIEAIAGLTFIYTNKSRLVPVNEMTDCLVIKAKSNELKLNSWVRIKRGKYSGDLGQVLDILDGTDSATIKLIPRIDYQKNRDGEKSNKGVMEMRQPAKLFNPNDINKRELSQLPGGFQYQNEFFDKDGYLEKSIKLMSLEQTNVNATLDEITSFSGNIRDSAELAMLGQQSNIAVSEDFRIGENVIAVSGEAKNVSGVVKSIDQLIVTVEADAKFKLLPFKIPAKNLSKLFKNGDHVKVTKGLHKEETGLVVNIDNNIITIMSDTTLLTVNVFSKDLITALEVTSSVAFVGQYDIGDLVTIDSTEVGVIVKAQHDYYTVLNQFGKILKIKQQNIRGTRDSSRSFTETPKGDQICTGDSVMVIDDNGGNKKSANVLHVHRSFVFLQAREVPENNGIFIGKVANILVANSRSGKMNGTQKIFASRGGTFGGRGNGRDPLVSQTVNIIGGPWKGYLGIVKDTTETTARVELHTNNRIITVDKTKLVNAQNANPSAIVPQVSDVPSGFGKTPMYMAAKTPHHPSADGGRTVYAGIGTSAWDASSKTPAHDYSQSAWNAGAATPKASSYQNALANTARTSPPVPETSYSNEPSSPMYSSTGSVNSKSALSRDEWVTTDIEVRVIRKFMDGKFEDRICVIKQFEAGKRTSTVLFTDTYESHAIPSEFLTPTVPQRKQKFKVLVGENIGKTGEILSVDGPEGVVKFDGANDIVMMNLNTLAKFVE